jgi:hypothetical protein
MASIRTCRTSELKIDDRVETIVNAEAMSLAAPRRGEGGKLMPGTGMPRDISTARTVSTKFFWTIIAMKWIN